MNWKLLGTGLASLLSSACTTLSPQLPGIVRTEFVETPIPADCGVHPTAEEPVVAEPAPTLPPEPAAAPTEEYVSYLTIRTRRAEIGAVNIREERDSARDALARNAIPQQACASWYDAEMQRRGARSRE